MCKSKKALKEEIQNLKNRLWDIEQDHNQAVAGIKSRRRIINQLWERIVGLTKENLDLKQRLSKFYRTRGADGRFIETKQ